MPPTPRVATLRVRPSVVYNDIAPGTVNAASISSLVPNDVRHARQFHAFAGLGAWSYALRLAGWPDDRPVWTGSCPCQPFSVAGKGEGVEDERHLWPDFFRLIAECHPPVVFGEQVAGAAGRAWLDAVRTDLEGVGYAVGAADLCAAGVGAPHLRQRLYWCAYRVADAERRPAEPRGYDLGGAPRGVQGEDGERQRLRADAWAGGDVGVVADPHTAGRRGLKERDGEPGSGQAGVAGWVGTSAEPRGDADGRGVDAWAGPGWLPCRDGKYRPVEPGTFPLAHGAPARVGRLRGYGNAINAEAAIAWIESYLEAIGERAYATGGAEEASAVQA